MFFEILTILLVAIIVTGTMMILFSEGDLVIGLNGVMLSVFGASALLTAAKMTAARHQQSLRWLYEPLAALPEWILQGGIVITVVMFGLSVLFLMDSLADLLCRWRGGRH
ncbi:hypothetical protein FBF32_02610 [Candidatus Saccharibacteria bacterium oral taxon 488]|nr:hypothetical protein FBF32_02610 [Candidatus Saccharibacteria bacterium oral taxon 488]